MIKVHPDDLVIRHVRISDAKMLREAGFMSGSLSEVESRIRHLTSTDMTDAFVVMDDDDSKAEIFVRLYTGTMDMTRLSMHINHAPDIPYDMLYRCVDDVIKHVFFVRRAHKLSAIVTCGDEDYERALAENGFMQEAVLHDEVNIDGKYSDAGLFYILKPQYNSYNYAFVPFPRGIVAVGGTDTYVDDVRFLSYGSLIDDEFIYECADYLGLTSDDCTLLARASEEYDIDYNDIPYIPQEVIRATEELKEYFVKKRDTFDINVNFHEATDFQLRVWNEIKKVPYGATVSYEDIALRLTDNDMKKARRLTRAVGSACSENPVPIIIPCHRVIGKNGMLMGFSGGIEFKDFLLQNELFSAALPLY